MWVDGRENFHFYAIRGQKLYNTYFAGGGERGGVTRLSLTLHLPLGRMGLGADVAARCSSPCCTDTALQNENKAAFLLVVLQVALP